MSNKEQPQENKTTVQQKQKPIDAEKSKGSRANGSIKDEKDQKIIAPDKSSEPDVPASSEQATLGGSIDLEFALLKINFDIMSSEYNLAKANISSLTKDLAFKQDVIARLKSLQALSNEHAAKSISQMQNIIHAQQNIIKQMTLQNTQATLSLAQNKSAQDNETALRMKEKIENKLLAAEQEIKIRRLEGESEAWRQKVILSESKLVQIEQLQSDILALRGEAQIQESKAAQAKTVFDACQSIWREISYPREDFMIAATRNTVISRIKAQSKKHAEMDAQLSVIQKKLGLLEAQCNEVGYVQAIDSILKDQESLHKTNLSFKQFTNNVEEEFQKIGDLFNIPKRSVTTKGKASSQPPQFDLSSYSEKIKKEIRQALERERSLNVQLADETQNNRQALRKLNAERKEETKKLEEADRKFKEDMRSMNSKLALQIDQAKKNSAELARTKELLSKSEANLLEANKSLKTAKDRITEVEKQLTTMGNTLAETENQAKIKLSSTAKQASEEKVKELSELKTKLTKEHQLQLRRVTDQLSSKHLFEINKMKDESKYMSAQASKAQSKVVTETEREKTRAMNQLKQKLCRKHEEAVKQMAESHGKQLSRMESDCEEKVRRASDLIKQGERSYEQLTAKVERLLGSLSESFSSVCRRKIQLSLGNLDGVVQQIISAIENLLATAKFFPNSDAFGKDMMEHKAFLVKEVEKYVRESVAATKLVYHNDPLNLKSFHNYVDNRQHLLIVCRLMNGKVIASYTAQAFRESAKANDPLEGRGLLFSVTDKEVYQVKKTHQRNVITYDPFYLTVGNAEIRLRMNDMKLYTNFAIVNSFFDNRDHKVRDFVGQELRDVEMASYEIYQIHFKNEPL